MKTFSTEGIVLKRYNSGEADRILTIFTRENGKMSCVAKGVRKMTSSKRSSLEPGMHSKLFFASTHGLPILTQAQILEDFPNTRSSLYTTRSLSQILEIVDTVIVEEQGQEEAFDQVVEMLHSLNDSGAGARRSVTLLLRELLGQLGFQDIADTKFSSVSEYVEFISERKLRSFSYLTVQSAA